MEYQSDVICVGVALIALGFSIWMIISRGAIWRTVLEPVDLIFVSHRHLDSKQIAHRFRQDLIEEFGKYSTFIDDGGVEVGTPFPQRILEALSNCQFVFILIGKGWNLERLNSESDWVRREVAHAIASGCAYPVLVDGARMPRKEELPSDLQPLADLIALPLSPSVEYATNLERLKNVVRNHRSFSERKRITSVDRWTILLHTMCGVVIGSMLSLALYLREHSQVSALKETLSQQIRTFPLEYQDYVKLKKFPSTKNALVNWKGFVVDADELLIKIKPTMDATVFVSLEPHSSVDLRDEIRDLVKDSYVSFVARIDDLSSNRILKGTVTDIYPIPLGQQ